MGKRKVPKEIYVVFFNNCIKYAFADEREAEKYAVWLKSAGKAKIIAIELYE